MGYKLIIECKKEKVAKKLLKQLDGGKGILNLTIEESGGAAKTEKVKLEMPEPKALKAILTKVQDTLGADTVVDIFTTHGATKLKNLPEDEWPTVYAEAENLLKAHEEKAAKGKDKKAPAKGKGKDKPAAKKKAPAKGKGKTISLEDLKKLCSKVSTKCGIDRQREILKDFGMNTTRGLKPDVEQKTLNSIGAAMQNELNG